MIRTPTYGLIIFLIVEKYKKNGEIFIIFVPLSAYSISMKRLKHYCIIGALFVIVTGTLAHFFYDWSGHNFIVGFFFPVNESTWEHMKLCFFPMLLYSLYLIYMMKDTQPGICSASATGILSGTFAIPVLFYTYTGILGRNFLFLDIGVFIVSVILAFVTVYRLTSSCKAERFAGILWLSVAILGLCFVWFTYHSPEIGIFTVYPSRK